MHDTTLLIAYPAFERLRLFAMYTPTRQFAGYFNPKEYAMMVCMGTANSPFEFQTEGCYCMKFNISSKRRRILLVVVITLKVGYVI